MIVVDASALLAVLADEPGADDVAQRSAGGLISAVNLAEVLQKSAQRGIDPARIRRLIEEMDLGVVPFDDEMALVTAELWEVTRRHGLSLADRACLALTQAMSGVALTMDRAWSELEIDGVAVHVVQR